MKSPLPARRLPAHPDIDQLRRQAKELLDTVRAADNSASGYALHDAQLALARSYGFESWPKLKARVDGVTVSRLADAVRIGDLLQASALLKARPELATMEIDNHQVLHFAVITRQPEMARLLMSYGANARAGVYPHREATSSLTIAVERGYDEIVSIIRESEQQRGHTTPAQAEEPDGPLTAAVRHNQTEVLIRLLAQGLDPDERTRLKQLEDVPFSWGNPLWHAAGLGAYEMARMLLERRADPNARVYASGSPMLQAFSRRDRKMIDLLREFGGLPEATTPGLFRETELAKQMLAGEAGYRLDGVGGDTLAEQLLWGAACGGDPEVVRMALERVDWPRDDARWFTIMEQPLRIWRYGSEDESWDRTTYLTCFKLVLDRCDPNITARFGITILHSVAGSRAHVTAEERLAFAAMLLDAGARLDVRDNLLLKTPLGWARRWNRPELIELFIERGAAEENS